MRKLIHQYFTQLTQGCGNEACINKDCATGSGHRMNPTDAATSALAFATNHSKDKSKLCSKAGSISREIHTSLTEGTGLSAGVHRLSQFLATLTDYHAKKTKISVSVKDKYPPSGQLTR